MIGAIIGDIVGSTRQFRPIRRKEFELFPDRSYFTDDSVMSLAIAKALMDANGTYDDLGELAVASMQELGREHIDAEYGKRFYDWILSEDPKPYESFGNGAAMRISACGYVGDSIEKVTELAIKVTEVTHNHPDGINGGTATAVAVFLALQGKSKDEIREYVNAHYYPLNFTIDGIRGYYKFEISCQGTVPPAIMSFLGSTSFEDAIRNAISLGGDSDTLAAITGGIAEAYYGVPEHLRKKALTYLDNDLRTILDDFEKLYPSKTESP
jgi:type I restriction enzyme M protein